MNDHERHKKKLRQQFQNAQREVERLENELNDAEPDEGRLDQLKEQLLEAKETKTLDEGQYEDIVVKIDKLNSEAATQKAALEEVQKRVAQLNVELGKAQDKAAKAESKRQQALHAKNNALEAVEAATNNKGDWEQQRGKKLNDVEESTSQAEQICARVEVPAGETSKSLERTRERLQKDRAESEKE
jgi:chromosome segregation ATPase